MELNEFEMVEMTATEFAELQTALAHMTETIARQHQELTKLRKVLHQRMPRRGVRTSAPSWGGVQ